MQVTGQITDISIDYSTMKPRLTLNINEKQYFKENIDELKSVEKLDIEIKKHRAKRSLDSNSYYWSLLNQLVEVLQIGREELHFRFIREYSPVMLVPLMPNQEPNGYFKYYEFYKKIEINGKEANYYKVYKPSSEMNSKEFWVLLKGLEEECKSLGIETIEDRELKEMISKN